MDLNLMDSNKMRALHPAMEAYAQVFREGAYGCVDTRRAAHPRESITLQIRHDFDSLSWT